MIAQLGLWLATAVLVLAILDLVSFAFIPRDAWGNDGGADRRAWPL